MLLVERLNDHEEALRTVLDGHRADMWTAMPGYIVDFDATKQTATVQVGIRARQTQQDGTTQSVEISVIPDVMVSFPCGGGHTLTFPVKAGDECHLVFSSRNHDAWYQSGGVQEPLDQRMHNINDAIAYVGIRSQANLIQGISTTTTQLRSDDGATFVEVDGTGKNVNVTAPGVTTVTTPLVHFTGNGTMDGNLTVHGTMQVDKTIHCSAAISSDVEVYAKTTPLHAHLHSGTQPSATGVSGPPTP